MSVTINAKGTSVPYFTIGKGGVTIYQGTTDPALSYTVKEGDYWLDTSTLNIKVRDGTSTWIILPVRAALVDIADLAVGLD